MHDRLEHVTIRRATLSDANALADIGRVTFTQSYAAIIAPDDLTAYTNQAFSMDRASSELNNPSIIYLLAAIGTNVCAYTKLEPTEPPSQIDSPNPIELVRLYAAPGWTGKGIGAALIKAGLELATQANYQSCWLRVWRGNTEAIKFYRNWGFSEVGTEPYFVGQTCETVILMTRPLRDLSGRPTRH